MSGKWPKGLVTELPQWRGCWIQQVEQTIREYLLSPFSCIQNREQDARGPKGGAHND